MKNKDNQKQWIDCSTTTSGGTKLYIETMVNNPGEIFLNVQSASGCKNVGAIQTFTWTDTYDEPTDEIFKTVTEKMSMLRQGWRVPLTDYLEIVKDKGMQMISRVDLAERANRTDERNMQLVRCGSLNVEKDGPAIWAKDLETLVMEIHDVVKPGNVKKAKAGADARWDNRKTDTGSKSAR